jgi:hypothetical protein
MIGMEMSDENGLRFVVQELRLSEVKEQPVIDEHPGMIAVTGGNPIDLTPGPEDFHLHG